LWFVLWQCFVFPAQAGVIPDTRADPTLCGDIPRAGGGDPFLRGSALYV